MSKPAFSGLILPDEQMGIDVEAYDNVVRGKGIPLIHYRAIRCPFGLTDPSDIRRPHPDHAGCTNGFLYKAMGRVTSFFSSNQTDMQHLDMGSFDGSTALVTFPRFYDAVDQNDPNYMKRIIVRPYDKFALEQQDILTGTWDLSQRRMDDRPDRYEFPAVQVEHLIDSNGAEYHQNIDFDITADGDVRWRANKGPAVGTVYSAWYFYRPFYIVERLVKDLRLFPNTDFVDANAVHLERLGSGAVLQREYLHRTATPDAEAPAKTKDRQPLPPDGSDFV